MNVEYAELFDSNWNCQFIQNLLGETRIDFDQIKPHSLGFVCCGACLV